jgi:hypothetical protein
MHIEKVSNELTKIASWFFNFEKIEDEKQLKEKLDSVDDTKKDKNQQNYDFNDEYNVLIYQGKTYTFNTTQTLIMKKLYENYKEGKPVHRDVLIDKSEREGKNLRDVFDRSHPAWKDKLIKHTAKGFYVLQ